MVEPISLALISGAAGLGMALGRLTRDKPEELEPLPPAFDFEEEKEPLPSSNLQFFAVEEVVNPVEIIDLARAGKDVFISIKKMLSKTDKLYRFLHKLRLATEAHGLQVHQISKEILLVTGDEEAIKVRKLKGMVETELDDKLLHKSIAGY